MSNPKEVVIFRPAQNNLERLDCSCATSKQAKRLKTVLNDFLDYATRQHQYEYLTYGNNSFPPSISRFKNMGPLVYIKIPSHISKLPHLNKPNMHIEVKPEDFYDFLSGADIPGYKIKVEVGQAKQTITLSERIQQILTKDSWMFSSSSMTLKSNFIIKASNALIYEDLRKLFANITEQDCISLQEIQGVTGASTMGDYMIVIDTNVFPEEYKGDKYEKLFEELQSGKYVKSNDTQTVKPEDKQAKPTQLKTIETTKWFSYAPLSNNIVVGVKSEYLEKEDFENVLKKLQKKKIGTKTDMKAFGHQAIIVIKTPERFRKAFPNAVIDGQTKPKDQGPAIVP